MSDDPDDELPEVIKLHAALAVAVLGLDLIATGVPTDPQAAARATLDILRRKHPVAADVLKDVKV